MSAYFPEVAKLLVHADIVVKKMACWFIGRHCSDSNQALLVLNSLFGFVKQPNPILRVLALRTLADIPLENHLEFVLKLFTQSLDDQNPLVRRAAVLSCSKVYRTHLTSREEGHDLVKKFKSMVADPDALVSLNVINVLKEMMECQGRRFVISKPIAVQITNSLEKYPTLVRARAAKTLQSYEVTTPEEALDLMNALDCHLRSRSTPSARSAILSLILYVVREHLPQLTSEVITRYKSALLNHLNFEGKEITYALLRYLRVIIESSWDLFHQDFELFLCRKNDRPYIKYEKLGILPLLCSAKNQKQIVDNVGETFRLEKLPSVKFKVVKVLSEMALLHPEYSTFLVRMLINFVPNCDTKTTLAILKELVTLNYGHELQALRIEVTEVVLEWVLNPDVDRNLATSMVIFLGFYDDRKTTTRREISQMHEAIEGSNSAKSTDELASDSTNNSNVIPCNEDDDYVSKENEIPKNESIDDDEASQNVAMAEAMLIRVVQKLEEVFKGLNVIDYLCETDESLSYDVPQNDLPLLSALLSALLKHFLKQPAQCQPVLVEILDVCSKVEDLHLRNKCLMYINLLEGGVERLDKHFGEIARVWQSS